VIAIPEEGKIMHFTHVQEIHFSPAGTTKTIVKEIAKAFDGEHVDINLPQNPVDGLEIGANDLTVIGMPVFAGRIPSVCVDMLSRIKSNGSPAIVCVAYGNRAYDDALLELRDLAGKSGFVVIGCGAFVAQHSIFPDVARGRPDADDRKLIEQFAEACRTKLTADSADTSGSVTPKGKKPYTPYKNLPMAPFTNADCTRCGVCVAVCPVGAINAEHPEQTDKKKCITCAACVTICPIKARRFSGALYWLGGKMFGLMCSKRKEPETFL
jgi:ferredoxin